MARCSPRWLLAVAVALLGAATPPLLLAAPSQAASQATYVDTEWPRLPKELVRIDTDEPAGVLLVSFADRKLYHMIAPGRAVAYPIATPRRDARWEGALQVREKREYPRWTPTERMLAENPDLPRAVPGGDPRNPLGARALYLGGTLFRIHGTDAPQSIGQPVSSGCIRMYDEHVMELYDQVSVGARVVATEAAIHTEPLTPQALAASLLTDRAR